MRQAIKAELTEAMKESLRDLENLRLLNPNDREILNLRRNLKEKIAELEGQQFRNEDQTLDAHKTAA